MMRCFLAFVLLLSATALRAEESPAAAKVPKRLTLEEARRLALLTSSSLMAARLRREAAENGLKAARGEYLPELQLGALYSDQRKNARTSLFFEPQPFRLHQWDLGARQTIFDGFRREAGVEIAREGVAQGEFGIGAARRMLLSQVVGYFYGGVLLQKRIALARLNIGFEKETLDISRKRFEAGILPESDLLHFEQRVLRAENVQVELQADWHILLHRLAALFSMQPEDLSAIEELVFAPRPEVDPGPLEDHTARALAAREEIRILESRLRAERERERLRRAADYPVLSAFADVSNSDRHEFSFSDAGRAERAGLNLEWKLFNGFSDSYSVLEERAQVQALELDLDNARKAVRAEVATKWEEARRWGELRSRHKRLADLAARARDNVMAEFKAGRIDTLRVSAAQNSHDQAAVEYEAAEVGIAQALEELQILTSAGAK